MVPPDVPTAVSVPPPGFLDPIPGIIPFGTVTIFAGAPGVGKTAMLADWIVRWRDGRPIWGHPTNPPTQFCYLAADRQWASHQQWFNRAGYPDIPRYSVADDVRFNLDELLKPYNALDLFRRSLDKANNGAPPIPGAHVFVDPVSPVFIAGNPNSSRDVARTLLNMSRECQQRQINITCAAHFAKQLADATSRYARPQDRISGSGAFSGFSDTQIYLIDPELPKSPFHVLGWNPRLSMPEEFTCVRDPKTGLFMPFDIVNEDATSSEILDCFELMGPSEIGAIRERAISKGHSRATVTRALSKLLDERRIVKLGRGRYQRVQVH